MTFAKRIILPMILLLLISGTFFSFAIARFEKNRENSLKKELADSKENSPLSNLTNIDPTSFDSIVKNEYALASLKAKENNADNKLVAIDVQIEKDLTPSSVISRYVFSSQSDAVNNWTMTFTEINTNFIRAAIPKDDYLGNLAEINTKLWKFNFVTALQIAEKNGGLSWRESNELKSVRIVLKHAEPKNWLLWTVQYNGLDTSLLVKIDANSGRVVQDTDSLGTISN